MIQRTTGVVAATPDMALIRQYTRNLYVILDSGFLDEYMVRLELGYKELRHRHLSRTHRDVLLVSEIAGMVHDHTGSSKEHCEAIAGEVVWGTIHKVRHIVAFELANQIRQGEVQRD